ncbi:MAG: hypothetical protein DSM106950_45175 [Stigonema ocellatum SAG 48.90 = DSM 106950]|nr:hypothetical protein [Stigonema ocellatum SAG 48.90 = DSM 106950]
MNKLARKMKSAFLLTAAIVVSSFGLDAAKAYSQTSYTLDLNYDVLSQPALVEDDKFTLTVSGTSTDAPFGLNTINDFAYTQINPVTGVYRINSNPEIFSLENRPLGQFTLGSGSNKIFGTDDVSGVTDLKNLTSQGSGIFTITGGEGLFQGATGQFKFSETSKVSFEPNTPNQTRSNLAGTVTTVSSQKVPESSNNIGLVSIGLAASFYGLKKYKRSGHFNNSQFIPKSLT